MSRKLSNDPYRALDDMHTEIVDAVWEAFATIGRKYDMSAEEIEDILLDVYEAVDEETMQ